MSEGLFALAGVALGALINAVVNAVRDRTQREAERSDSRRLEVLDLVSAFLRDTDTLWRAQHRLVEAIAAMDGFPQDQRPRDERLAAFDEMRQPLRDATLAIVRMRIVTPALVDPAAALLAASQDYSFEHHEEAARTRELAMRSLEDLVRPMVS